MDSFGGGGCRSNWKEEHHAVMNLGRRKRRSVNAAVMENPLFEGPAQEMPTHCQYNGVRAYRAQEASLPVQRSSLGVNYSMASNSGSNMLAYNVNDNSQFFQQALQYGVRGSTVLVVSDGRVIPSHEGLKQVYGDGVSPAQITSVKTCSMADCHAPVEVVALSEPTSGDNMELDRSQVFLPGPTSVCFPEDKISVSSMPYSNLKLKHGQLADCGLQALTSDSEHCRPQSSPPTHVEIQTQMCRCRVDHKKLHDGVPVQTSPLLSLEQLRGFEENRFSIAQAPSLTNSTGFLQKVLVWYISFGSKVACYERRQQDFVHHLHSTLCPVRICECEKYIDLIAHFDRCQNIRCNICRPARLWLYAKKIGSGPPFPSEKITSQPNGHVSRDNIVQDMSPPPKRMKMDNAAKFDDDWSLAAVIRPHSEQRMGVLVNEEDSKEKTNMELLGSNEASKTAGTWNATADNGGGSMWSRKSDGLSGLGMSPEVINLASPNEVPKSTGNHGNSLQTDGDAFDLCNQNLGTDNAISYAEEHNSVDEKTRKVKSDETFCSSSSDSDSICVAPPVGDLGENHDALGLDNLNLGKDYDISPPEEHNLISEQQEIDCVRTSKVCQSLTSDAVSVDPQESPIVEEENFKPTSQAEHNSLDTKHDLTNHDNECGRKLDDVKESGVSLIDFFTAEQIEEHLRSLNQDINLSVGPEMFTSKSAHTVESNTCQLCGLDTIMFTALDTYCTSCEARIKHNINYYWIKDGAGARYCFCTTCFKNARRGKITCRGLSFPKAHLYKSKNTEESGEEWVQCDKCERWQHQICALYNVERDKEGRAKYTCPVCRQTEMVAKGHVPVTPPSGAHDLPRTKLSDCIEQRLFTSLQLERKQRAEREGKTPEEVPGVSDLKVRVASSVKKQLKVKQQFLDFLHDKTYPTEFPYKSKLILLFQKIEGVDVCLFAMYVQEFGSECENPNKGSVYISYIDSVKYFRPEVNTVSGVALRTFVYHEILIGYLDYCKQLGFHTCYIWSCPPLKGDDYILLSHPETQKRPNPNKLVQWYKRMLRKAKEENIVVGLSNFFEYFFVPTGDSNSKISAARLPYFDGDYWSRAIHDIIQSIEDNGGESDRQLTNKMTKRTMKAMGHKDPKDIRVMEKLGQKILPVKDEFFVIQLQFTCASCCEAIRSGSRWSCKQCSKFHLCGRCHKLELSSNLLKKHTDDHGAKHQLYEIPVTEVAADTDDKDILLDNDFFKDRHSFLNFCMKKQFRFDTLRRAKHSSMMILHHLHASRETMCRICNENVVEGRHCEICSSFRVCHACYQREGDGCHVHQLVELEHVQQQRASETEGEPRKGREQQQQQHETAENGNNKKNVVRLEMLANLLEHANECRSTRHNPCSHPNCLPIRQRFSHCRQCIRRVAGGCNHCKKIWLLLLLHSRKCKASNCTLPRCMDIKNHMATKSDRRAEREVV